MKTHTLLLALTALACLPTSAFAWGGEGHAYTAHLAVRSLPAGPLKEFLRRNETWFAEHSSHADRWRNRPDNAENGRHFLDGERFGFGTDLSKLPRKFDDLLTLRTYDQLRSDGIVPWTIGRRYQLLVRALKEKRWEDVLVQASYVSHYVADSHVPFHATENYDGQLSQPSQKGIHSRFESEMVQRSIALDDLQVGAPTATTDPVALTLKVLTDSIGQVEPILAADRAAGTDYTSENYWRTFTARTRPIAVQRLESGGRDLAGILLAAWNAAGKPNLPRDFVITDSSLPYAPIFAPRGVNPPALPIVPEAAKIGGRRRVQTIRIASKALGKEVPVNVLLPVGYHLDSKRYSVLYLLHGASGDHLDWNNKSGVAAYAAEIPLIIVMPDAMGDSFYHDTEKGGAWGTFFRTELLPTIEKQYRTIAKREGRALAGLSMGGYGAWRLGLDQPDKFIAASSLSGAIGWGEGEMNPGLVNFAKRLYGENPEKGFREAALWGRIERLLGADGTWKGPTLYFDCGKDDFLIPSNREMEKRLMIKEIPYEFAEFEGAHTWEYWDTHIRDVLNFTLRHVAKPK